MMNTFDHTFDAPFNILYDPLKTGVTVLKTYLGEECLIGIRAELEDNRRNFVQMPYQYGTTVQGLSSWDFERGVMSNYTHLGQLSKFYDKLSHELHSRMRGKELDFDQVKVNASHYPAGSVGIGPHTDNSFSVNFVAIFVISGCNDFFTARDKDATDEVALPLVPGDCVLMRGMRRLEERHLRPIHYVKKIVQDRQIITFREINRKLLVQTKEPYNL